MRAVRLVKTEMGSLLLTTHSHPCIQEHVCYCPKLNIRLHCIEMLWLFWCLRVEISKIICGIYTFL